MVGHVLLMGNPKKKKKARKGKMPAALKAYWAKKRAGRRGSAKKKKRTVRETIIAVSNPRRSSVSKRRKVRKSRKARRVIRARTNPRRRRFIRARRNPRILSGGVGGFLGNSIVPAAIGAVGALGVDLVIGNLTFIPQSMKTGSMLPITRAIASLAIGAGVGMVMGEEAGEQATAGGLIVAIYATAKSYLQAHAPNVKLARYMPVSRYLAGRRRQMGFIRRRLAAMPPAQRMAAIRAMRQRKMGLGKVGKPGRINMLAGSGLPMRGKAMRGPGGGMGYINPARVVAPWNQPANSFGTGGNRFGMGRYIK